MESLYKQGRWQDFAVAYLLSYAEASPIEQLAMERSLMRNYMRQEVLELIY